MVHIKGASLFIISVERQRSSGRFLVSFLFQLLLFSFPSWMGVVENAFRVVAAVSIGRLLGHFCSCSSGCARLSAFTRE